MFRDQNVPLLPPVDAGAPACSVSMCALSKHRVVSMTGGVGDRRWSSQGPTVCRAAAKVHADVGQRPFPEGEQVSGRNGQ